MENSVNQAKGGIAALLVGLVVVSGLVGALKTNDPICIDAFCIGVPLAAVALLLGLHKFKKA